MISGDIWFNRWLKINAKYNRAAKIGILYLLVVPTIFLAIGWINLFVWKNSYLYIWPPLVAFGLLWFIYSRQKKLQSRWRKFLRRPLPFERPLKH